MTTGGQTGHRESRTRVKEVSPGMSLMARLDVWMPAPSVCRSNLFLIEYLSIGTQRGLKIPTPPFDIIYILGLNTKSWILFCLHTYVIILIHSPPPMPSVTLTHLQLPSPILETVPVGGFWFHEVWPFVGARGLSP